MKHYHFIAIGGAVMHNMAIALHKKGYKVTGSDDEIFEPSRSRLMKHGLLPPYTGWNPDIITGNTDAIILGMHAHKDNPELKKAIDLGIKIFSFPEFLYNQSKNKKRIVIGGSHGKTTTTGMIMHVLKKLDFEMDYMVGSQLDGFEDMVKLSDAPIAVFEGDEYLSSRLDPKPKFLHYKPHIAVITGIAWDHINVFPTFEEYVYQFKLFSESIEKGGCVIYNQEDEELNKIIKTLKNDIEKIAYNVPEYYNENGNTYIKYKSNNYKLSVFGKHNLQNIAAAGQVCTQLGIGLHVFYEAISSFKGAGKRLQLIAENNHTSVFLDFAHSPSKLKATTSAVKSRFPKRKLIACMELHTYSSLKKEFLPQYRDTMKDADVAFVYFNPDTIKHKRLEEINPDQVAIAFATPNIKVFTDKNKLVAELKNQNWENATLLLMSSGNFSGIDIRELANFIIND